jgi:hypothetical protein
MDVLSPYLYLSPTQFREQQEHVRSRTDETSSEGAKFQSTVIEPQNISTEVELERAIRKR